MCKNLTPPAGDEKPERSGGFLFPLAGLVERSRFAAEKNYRHWEFPFKYSTIERSSKKPKNNLSY
jgi:hypothetical protein